MACVMRCYLSTREYMETDRFRAFDVPVTTGISFLPAATYHHNLCLEGATRYEQRSYRNHPVPNPAACATRRRCSQIEVSPRYRVSSRRFQLWSSAEGIACRSSSSSVIGNSLATHLSPAQVFQPPTSRRSSRSKWPSAEKSQFPLNVARWRAGTTKSRAVPARGLDSCLPCAEKR